MSPVGFHRFDVAHQVLSEADTENLRVGERAELVKACAAELCLLLLLITTRWQR